MRRASNSRARPLEEVEAAIHDLLDGELSEDSILDGSGDSEDEADEVSILLAS